MLTELPECEIQNLCDILHKEWPDTIQAISFIKTCSKWKKKKPTLDISILYDADNVQSGIFFVIYNSGTALPIINFYALHSYENQLEELFLNLPVRWNESFLLDLILDRHIPIVKKVITSKKCSILDSWNLVRVTMDIDQAKNLEINYPTDVEIKSLSHEHLEDIYNVWTVKDVYTIEELENCLEMNHESALGIFCRITGRLLCRCFRSHNGAILALQTIEECRKKGYATLLIKHISKKLAELSIVPCAHVNPLNEKSLKVFLNVGYRSVGEVESLVIGKSEPNP